MDVPYKFFLTLILLHLFLAFVVNLPKQDSGTRNWARLFGLAQIIMAIQYAVWWKTDKQNNPIGYTLSALNNPFYLGAALFLLDKKNLRNNWRFLFFHPLFQVVALVTILAIGIHVFAASTQTLLGVVDLAIALVSILVYLVEGYAYFSILEFFRYRWARFLPILVAASFSVIEIILFLNSVDIISELNPSIPALFPPLRFLYLVSPFMILLIRISQDAEVKEAFGKAIEERHFILSKETGLVEALGRSCAADKVLLLIKRPDFSPDESNSIAKDFAYYGWQEKRSDGKRPDQDKDELLRDITEVERICTYKVCNGDQPVFCKSKTGVEAILLPIIMYGGMIGVLFVRLSKGVKARSIFAEKLKLSLRTIVPLVQSSRQLAAIRILSNHVSENLIRETNIDHAPVNGMKLAVTEGIDDILASMLQTLSPLAIALKPSQHFNSEKPVIWQVDESAFSISKTDSFEKKYFNSELNKEPLDEVTPFAQDLKFGRIIMFVRQGKDSLARPTIGLHENVFNALGAIINTALKVVIRRNLQRILNAADKKIRERELDEDQAVQVLQEAARAFGIAWTVIALDRNRFFGDDDKIAFVQQRPDFPPDEERITATKLSTAGEQSRWLITFSTPWIVNSRSKRQLHFWFGINNPDFVLDDTWRDICTQFIQLATNKIKDMVMKEMAVEIETSIAEIEKNKAIMTLVHLQGHLTHEFGSRIKDHEFGIKGLEADIEDLELQIPEKIEHDIEFLKTSYYKLLKLTRAMFWDASRTKLNFDDNFEGKNVRPSNLCLAITDALDEVKLKSSFFKIETTFSCSDEQKELMVDAPYAVVYLSVANLLSNSIKALSELKSQSREKKIDIRTTVNGKHIFCRITDTGPGISEIDKLYDLESSWGLHLTRASLRDNNCTIEVIETGPSGTTFELRFPQPESRLT